MSFDPKSYAAEVRKMSGAVLLERYRSFWRDYVGAVRVDSLYHSNIMQLKGESLYNEILRRLSPKVDRAKLAELLYRFPVMLMNSFDEHKKVSDTFADLIESGQVPTVEE